MFKLYSFIIIITLVSCNTKIRYIGKTLQPTDKVDVYIAESSIKQPFEYIGKGYVCGFGNHNPSKIQKKSIKAARQNGANAVLIMDYYTPNTGTSINSVYRTDSIGRSLITTGNATVSPVQARDFDIFFLKYNK